MIIIIVLYRIIGKTDIEFFVRDVTMFVITTHPLLFLMAASAEKYASTFSHCDDAYWHRQDDDGIYNAAFGHWALLNMCLLCVTSGK